jgi:hypothetical protein
LEAIGADFASACHFSQVRNFADPSAAARPKKSMCRPVMNCDDFNRYRLTHLGQAVPVYCGYSEKSSRTPASPVSTIWMAYRFNGCFPPDQCDGASNLPTLPKPLSTLG